MRSTVTNAGQVLVLFVLFLLVLLGVSALAIDYAGWLLTDRYLQNVADHAALAGAAEFRDRQTQGSCGSGLGQQKCIDARAQMWTSLNEELNIITDPDPLVVDAAIAALALTDSPANGTTSVTVNATTFTFEDRIWVTTPPPTYAAYTGQGGRFGQNFGVTFTRVDRDVRSFLGGALGIQPDPRAGWATAGALPIGFALQTFCRSHIAPQGGACVNSAGVTIDGHGGIRLIRGDIGSNESLKVTANNGQGVQLHEGNVFVVNETCSSSTWNCPNGPPSLGGISNGSPSFIGKNAFYMAPWPVPHFASPIDVAGISAYDCSGASAGNLCVPYKDQNSSTPSGPGDWTCQITGPVNRCGTPAVTSGTVSCVGQGGGLPPLHYYPIGPSLNSVNADAAHPQSNANKYRNIDDDYLVPDADTTDPPGNPATDYLYIDDVNISGAGGPQTTSFTVNLGQAGPRLAGISTVRYTAFKTFGGAPNNTGNPVRLRVTLLAGSTTITVGPWLDLTDVPDREEFTVGAGQISNAQFNSLRLEFTFESQGGTTAADERGGAIAWAEIEHPEPQPALAPMVPPGYYRSIDIPASSCAILDPTAEYSGLRDFQMPGIYRFGGTAIGGDKPRIELNSGSYLIGDGVTFVFDSDWPDSGSQQGLTIDSDAALVLNTLRVPGTPPCAPSETETVTSNQSSPLSDLPYSAVCAAWGIDHTVQLGIRPGQNAWHYCDTANPDSASHCVERSSYNPTVYRGVTFYFTPDPGWGTAHGSMSISRRFEMQAGVGGLAFRGVLYAPYDDVSIQGGNGFDTVGQVLAWTAKFHGGTAFIDLDFPYDPESAAPYLLEPTIDH